MLRWLSLGTLAGVIACSIAAPASPESGNANATESIPSSDAGPPGPTFASDIEPLFQEKCQNCHRAGGIAPFSLVTYEEIAPRASYARQKIEAREMPPWGAFDDDDCKVQHSFKDNLSMTDEQIALFGRWVDTGMPIGDPALRPPPKTDFAKNELSDAQTFALPAPYDVTPGADDIRCFPIDPGLTSDAWVGATNVLPGDPRVVHHVIVYLDPNKQAPAKAGAEGSYKCFGGPGVGGSPSILVAWAPGAPPAEYGLDAGLKIPKTAGLVMQVHYHPSNVTVKDQTKFQMRRLPAPPKNVAQVILAGNARNAAGSNNGGLIKLLAGPDDPASGPAFIIPADRKAHTESMVLELPKYGGFEFSLKLAAVGAHMHWAGVDLKMDVERKVPGTQPPKECLLGVPKYDFNWQRGYAYDEPLEKLPTLSSGDKVTFTCTYDNTMENKHVAKAMRELLSPTPVPLELGESTDEEMCLGVLLTVRPYIPLIDE